jgi:UDP-N-acetylmuramate--alanine ligase
VTIDILAAAVRQSVADVRVVRDLEQVPHDVAALARAGDLVITLGAGSIGTVGDRILAALDGASVADPVGGRPR